MAARHQRLELATAPPNFGVEDHIAAPEKCLRAGESQRRKDFAEFRHGGLRVAADVYCAKEGDVDRHVASIRMTPSGAARDAGNPARRREPIGVEPAVLSERGSVKTIPCGVRKRAWSSRSFALGMPY